MEYININVTMPVNAYIELDNKARKLQVSKNEIILDAIIQGLSNRDKRFAPLKNARFYTRYN